MSKAKRIRQGNRRTATVHAYTVRQGLATCPHGSCPNCRTPKQQELLETSSTFELERAMRDVHRVINTPARPTTPAVRRPRPFQKPPRRRHVHRNHPWRVGLLLARARTPSQWLRDQHTRQDDAA